MNGRGGEAVFGATAANATPMALDHILAHVSSIAAGDEQIHAVITGTKYNIGSELAINVGCVPINSEGNFAVIEVHHFACRVNLDARKIFNGLCIEQSDRNQFSPIHADTSLARVPVMFLFANFFEERDAKRKDRAESNVPDGEAINTL